MMFSDDYWLITVVSGESWSVMVIESLYLMDVLHIVGLMDVTTDNGLHPLLTSASNM